MDDTNEYLKTIRNNNYLDVQRDDIWTGIIQQMREIEIFLGDFRELSFGRNFILCEGQILSFQRILTSIEMTIGSVISCCEFGCFTDANVLLRKCWDDMLFCSYVATLDTYERKGQIPPASLKNAVLNWWVNDYEKLKAMNIDAFWNQVERAPFVGKAVKKYHLRDCKYRSEIDRRMNNNVHGNGYRFYNCSYYESKHTYENDIISQILSDMKYLTTVFVFLLTLCSPISIMSTDYEDCKDCGIEPPEGSQNWVAPFVEEFFKSNCELIDKTCIEYLRENTHMDI